VLFPGLLLSAAIIIVLIIRVTKYGVSFDVFNTLAIFDALFLAGYIIWIMLEAVSANDVLMNASSVLLARRVKLTQVIFSVTTHYY
jgi:hypothetical protein